MRRRNLQGCFGITSTGALFAFHDHSGPFGETGRQTFDGRGNTGNEESAGVNYSHRCPKGNRQMRRVLNQAANAAVKAKGTIFAVVYRRIVPRLGHAQAIGAITHRLCRLIWKILHERVRYEERGPSVDAEAKKVRARKMIRELRGLGYRVELLPTIERPGMIRRDFRPWLIREAA